MADRRRKYPPHGTRARYNHRSDPCRCPACTEANTTYERHRRAEEAARNGRGVVPVLDDAGATVGWQHPLFEGDDE